MSEFSKQLNAHMERINCTSASLAKLLQMNITLFSKIKTGTRKLTEQELLYPLMDALQLTELEKDLFIEAYKKDMIGSELYESLLSVKHMLEQIGEYHFLKHQTLSKNLAIEEITAESSLDVLILVKQVLELESKKDNAYIRVISQPDFTALNQLLNLVLSTDDPVKIDHIFALQIEKPKNESHYNIHTLSNLFPLLLSSSNYRAHYYYDDIIHHFNTHTLFPYVIITSEYTLTISYDLAHANLSTNQKVRNVYVKEFTRMLRNTKEIIHPLETPIDIIQHYQTLEEEPFHTLYTIEAQPCFNLFITNKIMHSCVSSVLPQIEDIIALFNERRNKLIDMREKFSIYSYFTKEGIINFLEDGYFSEVPKAFCQPITLDSRISILERLYNAVSIDDSLEYHLLNTDKFHYPNTLILSGWDNNQISLVYKHPTFENICFALNEKNISSLVVRFLDYLKNSSFVYTKEETLKFLHTTIQEYKKRL